MSLIKKAPSFSRTFLPDSERAMRSIFASSLLFLSVTILISADAAPPKKEDMPKYIAAVSNPSATAKVRAEAAEMIGKRGAINVKDVESAIEPLKRAAQKDKDANVRSSAVTALGSIAPEPASTVPLLIEVLKNDASQEVKFSTVFALSRFGPQAKSALPAIRDFSKNLDKKQAKAVRTATAAITGN